jgi:hypothetical protein
VGSGISPEEERGRATLPGLPDAQRETVVQRDEVAVMFKRVADEQTAISRGWVELEQAVGSLRVRVPETRFAVDHARLRWAAAEGNVTPVTEKYVPLPGVDTSHPGIVRKHFAMNAFARGARHPALNAVRTIATLAVVNALAAGIRHFVITFRVRRLTTEIDPSPRFET